MLSWMVRAPRSLCRPVRSRSSSSIEQPPPLRSPSRSLSSCIAGARATPHMAYSLRSLRWWRPPSPRSSSSIEQPPPLRSPSRSLPQPLALLLHRGCARHHSSGLLASPVALWLRSFTSAGSSRGSPVRRDRRVPRQPEPPRHVGRCRHANTGTAPYLPWLARRRQQSGATSPELQPRVGGGQSQAGTEVAWPSGESYVRKGASPLPYDIEPVDHLTGTQQYRRRGSLGSADDVDRVVDPVREVDVQPTSRPEHHSVSSCHAAVGMGSRVEGAFVRLHLRQPDRHRADSQLTTEQLRSHVDRGLSEVGQLGHDVTLMGPVRCPT